MKSQALSDKAKRLAKHHHVTSNLIINHYFFDSVLKRIAKTKYQNHFILKGGYLLSIDLGIITRTTNDLDFLLNINASENTVRKVAHEILKTDIGDSITYELKAIEKIKEGSGLRIKILSRLERIRQPITIDIAFDDPITPGIVKYSYTDILNEEEVTINIYPYETVLAEKLQTVVAKGIASSRTKDLYDLYIISKLYTDKISPSASKKALRRTFVHRDTIDNVDFILKRLDVIKNNRTQRKLWERYERNQYFAKDIQFTELIESIKLLIEKIYDEI